MKLIVTRPQHDVTTRYISSWAEEIIDFAKARGVEVIDLAREKARRNELEGRIRKVAPRVLFLNGHGGSDNVMGHDNEVLIQNGQNHELLKEKITYALSCDSAKELGQSVAGGANGAYIGYKDEFIFMADRSFLARPLDDPKAEPFMESSNQIMISLLKGRSVQESSERSKNTFREHSRRLSSSSADADALQAAQLLWWNMRHQICIGNAVSRI